MNFYKHHLGDYDADTSHISWDQDMAYTRLMRAYYRREKPIPHADRYRLIRAVTKAQKKAADHVLDEFFFREGDEWHQKRCDEEIVAYQAQATMDQRIAHSRKRSTTRERTVNEPSERTVNEPSQDRIPNQNQNQNQNQMPGVLSTISAQSDASTRVDEMLRALKEKGVNPDGFAEGWVQQGVTVEKALQATALARQRKPEPQRIPGAYLDAILRDNGAATREKPWFIASAKAIEDKGRTLGIEQRPDEQFPYFRARVMQAAGITDDDVRKAEADR